MNVGSLLRANAARFPDRVALIEQEREVSYDELNNRVNKLANKLLALNVRKGDKVSLYLGSCVAWAEIYFALSKIGAVVVPVNLRIKGNELVHIVKNSGSTVLFFDSALKDHIDSMREKLSHTLSLDIEKVSVKASTANGLGEIGKVEAIAAMVVTMIGRED